VLGGVALLAAGYLAYQTLSSTRAEEKAAEATETENVQAQGYGTFRPEDSTEAEAETPVVNVETTTEAAPAPATTEAAAPTNPPSKKKKKNVSPKKTPNPTAKPKILPGGTTGRQIKTPYGYGTVVQERSDGMLVVALDFDGSQYNGFINRDAVLPVAAYYRNWSVGSTVETHGLKAKSWNGRQGIINRFDDVQYRVAITFDMPDDKTALRSIKPENLKIIAPDSSSQVGEKVNTPYGPGVVQKERDDGIFEVLLDFDGSPYTGYLNKDALTKYYPGAKVTTNYGPGVVLKERLNGMVDVQLDFDGSPYTGYLNKDAITDVVS
jgi:hypothetical protein